MDERTTVGIDLAAEAFAIRMLDNRAPGQSARLRDTPPSSASVLHPRRIEDSRHLAPPRCALLTRLMRCRWARLETQTTPPVDFRARSFQRPLRAHGGGHSCVLLHTLL